MAGCFEHQNRASVARTPLTRLLDVISDIWFGVGLFAAIFIYSSLGSAVPPIRQGAMADWLGWELLRFEKTESQWFAWWPFKGMIGLLCVSVALATVRRVRFNLLNAGVWAIHGGIIVLAISAAVHFANKVEGDAAIFHSRALIRTAAGETAELVVRPRAMTTIGTGDRAGTVGVVSIDPRAALTDDGLPMPEVLLAVALPGTEPFVRSLPVDQPDQVRDWYVRNQQLVPSSRPSGLADDGLAVTLGYDPVAHFCQVDTVAVYIRPVGRAAWTQLRARDVPHYYEYVPELDAVDVPEGLPIGPRPLHIPTQAYDTEGHDAPPVTVAAYLPYAWLSPQGRPEIVARERRQPMQRVGRAESLLGVRVGADAPLVWLRYHEYPWPDALRAQPDRFLYAPAKVTLPDGRAYELLYSRWEHALPEPLALDRFVLLTQPGGDRHADYVSYIRAGSDGGWSDIIRVQLNRPAALGPYHLFQARWDPGAECHTVLGIGTRPAVGWMLGGVCLSIAGMIYVFYIKPTIIRRRQERAVSTAVTKTVPAQVKLPPGVLLRVAIAVVFLSLAGRDAGAEALADRSGFAAAVDVQTLGLIAVQHDGRVKTLDTLARESMTRIAGTPFLPGENGGTTAHPVFSYLDLLLAPEAHADQRLFYVKRKPSRAALVQAAGDLDEATAAQILEDGRVSRAFLADPGVSARIGQLSRDLVSTARDVEMLEDALTVADARQIEATLRIAPPPSATSIHQAWIDVGRLEDMAAMGAMQEPLPEVAAAWSRLADTWAAADAAGVNAAAAQLSTLLAALAPAVYPQERKLALERWYYSTHKMTWGWLVYLAAAVPLLMGFVYDWPRARLTGRVLFVIAFAVHTTALGIRWYLAGRIPNSNMFEAVLAAAWFGAALGLLIDCGPWLARFEPTWASAWTLAATGAIAFAVAPPLQGVNYGDWQQWGPLPTAGLVVMAIGLSLAASLAVARRKGASGGLVLLAASACGMVALMCGRFLGVELHSDISSRMPVLNDVWLYIHTNMIIASYALIAMAAVTALLLLARRGVLRLRPRIDPPRPAGMEVTLDGATMLLLELSFIMLWTGIIMGAVWADHSWGRPWGWDPKEVFALNTWVVFLGLVHVRRKVRDKAAWTAGLAVAGCVVMLFNWIVVNFYITGLHSYA